MILTAQGRVLSGESLGIVATRVSPDDCFYKTQEVVAHLCRLLEVNTQGAIAMGTFTNCFQPVSSCALYICSITWPQVQNHAGGNGARTP